MKNRKLSVALLLSAFLVSGCSTSITEESKEKVTIPPQSEEEEPEQESEPQGGSESFIPSSSSSQSEDPHKGHAVFHYAAVEPTCEVYGNKETWYCVNDNTYYLSNPGGNVQDEEERVLDESSAIYYLAPLGHDWSDWEIETEASCSADGSETRTCATCNEVEMRKISKTGHTYGPVTYTWNSDFTRYTASRTCTQPGCGHVDSEEVKTDLVVNAATCTEPGNRTYTAREFNKTQFKETVRSTHVVEVGSLGHSMTYHGQLDPTCTDDGHEDYYYCSRCERYFEDINGEVEILGPVNIPTSGHNYVSVTTPPTCTEPGYTTHTCSVCGDHYIDNEQEALGHSYGPTTYSWILDELSGEYTGCTASRTCTRNGCGHVHSETAGIASVTSSAGKVTYVSEEFASSDVFSAQTKVVNDHEHTYDSGVVTAPTCTEDGYITYTCTQDGCGASYVVMDTDHPHLGHEWGEATYEWSTDHLTCTGTRVCLHDSTHVEQHEVSSTLVTTQPSCVVNGRHRYTAVFDYEGFSTQIYDDPIVAPGHVWGEPSYSWDYDHNQITATRVCLTDQNHIESETIDVTSEVTTEPTCTASGIRTYTAGEFTNPAFEDYIYVNRVEPKLGHSMTHNNEVEATCTADGTIENYYCSRCEKFFEDIEGLVEITGSLVIPANGHDYEETVTPPTCTLDGYTTHTCIHGDDEYIDSYVDALGHLYEGDITYTWSSDYTKCTASRTCSRCGHVDTETVDRVSTTVLEEPTETSTGVREHVSDNFEMEGAEAQTTTSIIPKTTHVHAYGEATYEWADDYSYVTGTRECECGDVINEVVSDISSEVTKDPTCTELGETTYTSASFVNEGFEAQEVVVENVNALGHDYDGSTITYIWDYAEDHYEVTASIACKREGCEHILSETKTATLVSTVEATCTTDGYNHYSVSFVDTHFSTQTMDDPIDAFGHNYIAVVTDPTCLQGGYTTHTCSRCGDEYVDSEVGALGHNWSSTTYTWATDYSSCTASRTCLRDGCEVVEIEDGKISFVTTKEAGCETTGTGYYQATFINTEFTTQKTANIIIPAFGHSWGGWVGTSDPTCTEKGEETRTCLNDSSHTETRDVDPLGHDWGDIIYSWSGNYSTCTAARSCLRDNCDEVIDETVNSTWVVTTEPTCENVGYGKYVVSFENPMFENQETDPIEIAALGHKYLTNYRWEKDSSNIDKYTVCQNDIEDATLVTSGAKVNKTELKPANNWRYNTSYFIEGDLSPIYSNNALSKGFGDVNIHFSNYRKDESGNNLGGNSKGMTYDTVVEFDFARDEITNAKDNFFVKIDNSFYYSSTSSYTGNSYVTFFTDLSFGVDSDTKNGFAHNVNYIKASDSLGHKSNEEFNNDTEFKAQFLEFTQDCHVVTRAWLNDSTKYVTVEYKYYSNVEGYEELYQGYTQTFTALYNDEDFNNREVNSVRIARNVSNSTMDITSVQYTYNIDRNIVSHSYVLAYVRTIGWVAQFEDVRDPIVNITGDQNKHIW